jgi:hypothetical protein
VSSNWKKRTIGQDGFEPTTLFYSPVVQRYEKDTPKTDDKSQWQMPQLSKLRSASKTLIAAVERQKEQHQKLQSSGNVDQFSLVSNIDKGFSPVLIKKSLE